MPSLSDGVAQSLGEATTTNCFAADSSGLTLGGALLVEELGAAWLLNLHGRSLLAVDGRSWHPVEYLLIEQGAHMGELHNRKLASAGVTTLLHRTRSKLRHHGRLRDAADRGRLNDGRFIEPPIPARGERLKAFRMLNWARAHDRCARSRTSARRGAHEPVLTGIC